MDLTPLLLTAGRTAEATGRVVAFAGRTWFQPPLPIALLMTHPQPPLRPSGLGVLVEGVDLTALHNTRCGDGAVEGWASLAGVRSGEALHVTAQAPPRQPTHHTAAQDWRHPARRRPADGR